MISHAHRCLFVHVPKCAGQSVERLFVDDLGLDWTDRGELLLRPNDDPRAGPPRLAHLTAREYVALGHLDEARFREYFRFTVVRDPTARAHSLFRYLRLDRRMSFARFLADELGGRFWREWFWFVRPQADFVYDGERCLVDHVGRVERLAETVAVVAERVGIAAPRLGHHNRSERVAASPGSLLDPLRRVGNALRDRREDRLEARALEVLGDRYGIDYERFGYAPPDRLASAVPVRGAT